MLKHSKIEDWDNIRFFLAAARAGSLNAAAQLVDASQPTVSRRIAEFERNVGARLFDRHHDGLVLTEIGRAILDRAQSVEDAALALDRRISAHDADGIAGPVRIAATEGIGVLWLTPQLRNLARQHPDLRLEILIDNASANILRREADVALRIARPTALDLIARKVGEVSFSLFASEAYVAAHGKPETPGDLRRHSLAVVVMRHTPHDEDQQELLDRGPKIGLTTNSTLAHLAAIRAGYGIGLMPTYVGRLFQDLVTLLPETNWRRRELWIIAHPEVHASARIRWAADAIAGLCAGDPDMAISPSSR